MITVYPKPFLFDKNSAKSKNAGFTLIELLIVVLIIGVLAAVALPKYQVAVMRSKYTQLIALAEAYKKAEERFVMANGKYSFDFSNLDVVPPAGWEIRNSGKEIASSSGAYCTLQDGSGNGLVPTIYCSMNLLMYYPKYSSSERLCGVKNRNALAKKVCLSMGGVYANSVSGGNVDYYVLP